MGCSTKKFLHVFTAAVIFAAGFLFTQNVSAANTCCTYYKGAEKSNQCYDIGVAPTPGAEFACSEEADPTKKYSANLAGGYTVDNTVESSCIPVPGYIAENVLPSDAVCGYAKAVNGTEFLGKLADAKVALVQTSAAEVAQGFCCIAVGTAGSCSTPTLKTSVLSQVKNAVLGVGMQSLLPLPKTAEDKKGYNLLNYFDCPVGTQYYFASCGDTTPLPEEDAKKYIGGAASLNNYSLANYCAIKDAVPYYCACKTDKTVCFPTKYSDKAKCLADAPKSDYECANLEKGKTDCAVLAVNKPGTVNAAGGGAKTSSEKVDTFSVPDISDLNKLGTTDISVVIGRIIKGALGIIGTIAFALFVYAGLLWMVSGGNSDRMAKAKDILVWTSLGIAVIFASYAIVDIIFEVFR